MNIRLPTLSAALLATSAAFADGAVTSPADPAITASFDVLEARVEHEGTLLAFRMRLVGQAGSTLPEPAGALAGAPVLSYVWPTTLDPATVGFESGSGILALAATSHPDFDDTPLVDETGDGDAANDGGKWHSHWVVLTKTEGCGDGALGVRNIPEGETPDLPLTWPGLPLYIDSPGYSPLLNADWITIRVPVPGGVALDGIGFDGVTAALRVNADLHAPLLCVSDVFDVASDDLSLPGRIVH